MSKAKKLLGVACAALVGIVLLVLGWSEFRTTKKLQAEGKQTAGVVTDSDTQRGRKGRRSYYLTVTFKTEAGAMTEQRKKVARGVFDEASQAGTVNVTYLGSDPTVCAFGPKVKTPWSALAFGVGALVVAGVIAFGKSEEASTTAGPTSEAAVEKELLADNSKCDDQQKAA